MTYDEIRAIFDRILNALGDEQEKRFGRTCEEWIKAERQVMFNATNHERRKLGKMPVPMTEIEYAETYAKGHVDYSRKFTHKCVDLVLDRP